MTTKYMDESQNTSPEKDNRSHISDTFHAKFSFQNQIPDYILVSSSGTHFYVHRSFLVGSSSNDFGSLFKSVSPIVGDAGLALPRVGESNLLPKSSVSQSSAVLDAILSSIYKVPSDGNYSLSLFDLLDSITSLFAFGIALDSVLISSAPLYQEIVALSDQSPLCIYTTAAEYGLDDIAVAVSAQLLNLPLTSISEDEVQRMGPVYLKRLVNMQAHRATFLKTLLLQFPEAHSDKAECTVADRSMLAAAWTVALAGLTWEIGAGTSEKVLRSAFAPLLAHAACDECRELVSARVEEIMYDWAEAKTTI
ncbi:hypothetical protein EIP91_010469 [Steccherinum ochraceum]|uniref:BTB domain-containing protein n=1 Tax=Steccherinum ochraceum TaxID=92696 RepID=A0A4R0RZA1_9APHY|nr:hypothetical protein EIP91_010469 [Steccherinum ochraceum]